MELRITAVLNLAKGSEMSATRESFENWLQENVGTLPGREEVSVTVLAQQFEQDAEVAGYGHDVREDELGNIEDAIEQTIKNAAVQSLRSEGDDLAPVMDALEVDDPKRGP
ncbi:hypothetical protein [Mesorhizobium opportunistum]|uniref:Uncharacterized protein n=1 Tax=Mesorhizobium opportunistum (strain LMG 24607 / HAMBI 3007 / WSM2075) TaxID=536019 RepID=F7YAL9_MESOW|nr:hypothetical protein [Mesorhizobium opportunistum]AEH88779.1 hypothetical protein Mesop_4350 [Mesorhizobium opportunistum WSM2075]